MRPPSARAARVALVALLVVLSVGACYPPPATPPPDNREWTARALTAAGALMDAGPSNFLWSPTGATLAFIEPADDGDRLMRYDVMTAAKRVLLAATAAPDDIDLASAQWSSNGGSLLLTGASALWLLDAQTGALKPVAKIDGTVTAVALTPDGRGVSYTQDNDLYLVRFDDGARRRLTTDGGNAVFNGALDWVYNEELATRAAQPGYGWSPDGEWLMYLRLDESAVPDDPDTDFRPVPAQVRYTRYPTAGTPNPVASLHALTPGAPLQIDLPDDAEYVLPFFTWTPDSRDALYITVNREHTLLRLHSWNPNTGQVKTLIEENDPYWINEERYAAPVFLPDGNRFLWLSECDGFMHLYLYERDGALVQQLTAGDWMIDSSAWNVLTPARPVHVDAAGEWAYFIDTRGAALERQVERVNLQTGALEQVTREPGFHAAALSADGRYLLEQFSSVDAPPVTRIIPTGGGPDQTLAPARPPAIALPALQREFITVKARDGVDLHAQLVKPVDFDPARKYPVVVHWYGGPGLQMASNRYGATNIFNILERDILYTQAGYIVWRLDNRGSFGRGHAFETPVFGELGKAALEDQLAGIKYLRDLPYVDAARIGTDGKSFGGYMTLYALTFAPDVFRCGVAGAAPTDWSYYDTIYTERYMRTPETNPDGYAATNLIKRVDQLRTAPLLIHGLNDTNVHLQNSVNYIEALEAADKRFNFIPLPNRSHSFRGDGLVAALMASVDYFAGCLSPSHP